MAAAAAGAAGAAGAGEPDESLYSRQLIMLGAAAMKRMAASAVLVAGCGTGVGAEVAKNVALAGVKRLTLADWGTTSTTHPGSADSAEADPEPSATAACASHFYRAADLASSAKSASAKSASASSSSSSEKGEGEDVAAAVAAHIRELNPYTQVAVCAADLGTAEGRAAALAGENTDSSSASASGDSDKVAPNCVVLCGCPSLALAAAIGDAVRARGAALVLADVRGLFAFGFCDFGPAHAVADATGEECKAALLGGVETNVSSEGGAAGGRVVLTMLDDARHDLETGDGVAFRELKGALGEALNGRRVVVTSDSPSKLSFDPAKDVPEGDEPLPDLAGLTFEAGKGAIDEFKITKTIAHKSLADQLKEPEIVNPDLGKFEDPPHVMAGYRAVDAFREKHGWLPRSYHAGDADEVVELARGLLLGPEQGGAKPEELKEDVVRTMAFTARGSYVGQTAFIGGCMSQEVLKALSGKYMPLTQWVMYDARELAAIDAKAAAALSDADRLKEYGPQNDRLDGQRACFGQTLCDKLANTKLFMIGCGAIGCEMLKNFAMLGVACGPDGMLTVTDNDHIEKSNLNRQFLFRPADISHPKSERASAAAQRMNPALKVTAHQDKVGPDTQDKYDDAFFRGQDLICNALDNIAARLYVDGRCVQNRRPLLESGTLGPKGHVQVVLPHKTESYGSQRDPPEKDVPFCTLKSFPSEIEHCVEWARDFSFGGLFVSKPQQWNQLLDEGDGLIGKLRQEYGGGLDLRVVRTFDKLLKERPQNFDDCLQFARGRFQAYYVNKTKQLLHAFPLDHIADPEKGTLFWASPKRPPREEPFNFDDPTHQSFVISIACLVAAVWGLDVPENIRTDQAVRDKCRAAVESTTIPEFVPKGKKIVTDTSVTKDKAEEEEADGGGPSDDELDALCKALADTLEKLEGGLSSLPRLTPADFEKDDDSNHHIDFLAACANLRARMYSIAEVERLKVKHIAGRIMPAIATTTAAVSGAVATELVKLVKGCELEEHRNLFMSLAIPFWGFAEPVPPEKKMITSKVGVTIWDSWEVKTEKGGDMLLSEFVEYFDKEMNLTVGGVFKGAMMVYVPVMPGHRARLKKSMSTLLRLKGDVDYVDLIVTFCEDGKDDIAGPPVRFWLKK